MTSLASIRTCLRILTLIMYFLNLVLEIYSVHSLGEVQAPEGEGPGAKELTSGQLLK